MSSTRKPKSGVSLVHVEFDTLTEEQLRALTDIDAAVALLPQDEQDRYHACVQSVIDARAYAQAHAGDIFIT